MKLIRLITGFSLFICLVIAGCATVGQRPKGDQLSANAYLQKAATSAEPQKQSYLLSATSRYLTDRQLTQANQVLTSIDVSMLPPPLLIRYQLAKAKLLLLHHKSTPALQLLNQLNDNPALNQQQRLAMSGLYVMAFQAKDNVLGSIDHYNQMLQLADDSEQRQETLIQTWDYLQTLPTPDLQKMADSHVLTSLQEGWVDLILVANNSAPATNLQQSLQQWRTQFPNHPAEALLPTSFSQVVAQPSHQVSLLLPLSGPLASTGQAIRNGFFAAYYNAKKQDANAPDVKVIDSGNGHIGELYQQAVQNGSDFVVGPLTKNNLRQLISLNKLPVRTLALNTLAEPVSDQPMLYQFGLSPLDETQQVVHKAWQDNHTRAIVIAPAGSWGDTIANAFTSSWQQQGGTVVSTLRFNNLNNLSSQIRSLLHIDSAQHRYNELRRSLGKKVRFVPYRRQDVDMIFMAAQPNAARQVRPLLKYYYAGGIPVYGISSVYSGIAKTRLDRDLNGILFVDMPWVVDPNRTLTPSLDQLRVNVSKLWPKGYQRHTKLYALGVDAYHLISALNKLTLLPKFGVSGATGRLYLAPDQHIYRRLLWAQMQGAAPVLLH